MAKNWNEYDHINSIGEKTAGNIAGREFQPDGYHQDIQKASHFLVLGGESGAKYITHYGSGNSCWELENGERVIVNINTGVWS